MTTVVHGKRILSIDDDFEIRNSIHLLLTGDGYSVDSAAREDEAVELIQRKHPDLILISLAGRSKELIGIGQRIRMRSGLTTETPIVIFSLSSIAEGAESEFAGNIYLTAPDNFDQLRALLRRILLRVYRPH